MKLAIIDHNARGDAIDPRLALVDDDGYEASSVLLKDLRDALAAIPPPPPEDTSGWNICAGCGKPVRPSCEFWWRFRPYCAGVCRPREVL